MIDLGDLMNTRYTADAANIEKEYMVLSLNGHDHTASCNMTHDEAKLLQHNCEDILIALRTYLNAYGA